MGLGVCLGVSVTRGATNAALGPVSAVIAAPPGDTRTVVGLMPARLVSSRTSACWSGVATVTTTPAAPARAVRPERCRYALCSAGGSTCTTRAHVVDVDATSGDVGGDQHLHGAFGERGEVALARGLAQVAVQVDGWNAGGGELRASRLAPCLVRVKTRDRRLPPQASSSSTAFLSAASTVKHVVGHGCHRETGRVDLVGDRADR